MTTKTRPAWVLTAAAALWMALVGNLPLWRELAALNLLRNSAGWLLAGALLTMIACALFAITSLLAWKWTLKPALLVLLAMTAAGSYFMWTYHVVIDADMLVNVQQTDWREAAALLNVRMVVFLLSLFALPAVAVGWFPLALRSPLRQAGRNVAATAFALVAVVAVALASYQPLASAMRNHKQLRYLLNPLNSVYAVGNLASKPWRRDESKLEAIGMDATAPAGNLRPTLLVLVIGETARAANFGLNGYGRDTTPELARHGVTSFQDVSSCGTSTAASLPCMFSHLGRERFDKRPHNYENLLDVLQRAGLAVVWLDNQSGCKGVCDRVPHAETQRTDAALCTDGECLDGALLKEMAARLAALPPERRSRGAVVVMHQMGSHGPAYYKRSPAATKKFLPECTSNNLQDCAPAEILNAYDNSIAYTDQFLGSVIDWLKGKQETFTTSLVYVSDHGESLGENNLYLHGLPYAIAPDLQKKVPWITWFGPSFAEDRLLDTKCLQSKATSALTHDNYFHSVLGLLQIRTSAYEPRLDAYAACTGSRPSAQAGQPANVAAKH